MSIYWKKIKAYKNQCLWDSEWNRFGLILKEFILGQLQNYLNAVQQNQDKPVMEFMVFWQVLLRYLPFLLLTFITSKHDWTNYSTAFFYLGVSRNILKICIWPYNDDIIKIWSELEILYIYIYSATKSLGTWIDHSSVSSTKT